MKDGFLDPCDPRNINLLKKLLHLVYEVSEGKISFDQFEKIEKFFLPAKEVLTVTKEEPRKVKEKISEKTCTQVSVPVIQPVTMFTNKSLKTDQTEKKHVSEKNNQNPFFIGLSENNFKNISDNEVEIFSPKIKSLISMIRDFNLKANGWDEDVYNSILDFVTKHTIENLVLKKEILTSMSAEKIEKCLLRMPSDGIALIRSRKEDRILLWQDFNEKLLEDVISIEGIEFDNVADIIYVAPPKNGIVDIIFFRIPFKEVAIP